MQGALIKLPTAYYGALENSPFGNELLLGLAERAVDAEHLGSHDVPDLLCVSFSSNDVIGHCYGPDSQEVLDVTLRSDRIVAELLNHLDATVGKGRYVVALTADHGVCPLPEVSRQQGKDAGRIARALLNQEASDFLDTRFGMPEGKSSRWVEAVEGPWIYLRQQVIHQRGLQSADVEAALAEWLKAQQGIQAVYTRSQLAHGIAADDALGQSVRLSYYPDRAGDLFVVLKPYYLLWQLTTGTNHGTPHPYDTHVPLLVYGPGIRSGVRSDAVTPQATAAILAKALGIKPPAEAEAPVPERLSEPTAPGGDRYNSQTPR